MLTAEQQAVVDHRDGPLRVVGGFGTGKTAALRARQDALEAAGRRVLFIRGHSVASWATTLLPNGRRLDADPGHVVRQLLASEGRDEWPTLHGHLRDEGFVEEVAAATVGFEASFLGDEELFVHADAAGELARWEEVARFTRRYHVAMCRLQLIDPAEAIVAASLALRDPEQLATVRATFDDLIVDDYQLVSFAEARLLAQLAGRGANVVVAGNLEAAIEGPLDVSPAGQAFERFPVRFDATDLVLPDPMRRPAAPTLRIIDRDSDAANVVRALDGAAVLERSHARSSIGQQWPTVAVVGATDDRWPAPVAPPVWFDRHLFGGPDVPGTDAREREWLEQERRRFVVCCSRATASTVVIAAPPVTRFVGELLD